MKVAFVTLNAYDILTGGHGGTAGGAQLQQSLIARELVNRGHDVYFVEHDAELKTREVVEGIKIVTKPKPVGNFLKRALQACSGTFSALRAIDPDVCYFRVLDFEMFPVLAYCKLTDTRFVCGFASDKEVTKEPNTLKGPIKGSRAYLYLTRKALSSADVLIAQNHYQYERASGLFDTEVNLIPNGYTDPAVQNKQSDAETPTVLWVSRFRAFKRPELVLRIAEKVPEANFVVIGSENDNSLYKKVKRKANSLDNVEIVGYVPYEQINKYFEHCDVFLNTSESEGFPNTFLQAWAHRTPVASLEVDPNDIISEHDVGWYADGSVERLIEGLQEIVNNSERRRVMGEAAYTYFKENHSIGSVTDRYETVFQQA